MSRPKEDETNVRTCIVMSDSTRNVFDAFGHLHGMSRGKAVAYIADLLARSKVCTHCGAVMPASMDKCPVCGRLAYTSEEILELLEPVRESYEATGMYTRCESRVKHCKNGRMETGIVGILQNGKEEFMAVDVLPR